MNAKIGTDIFVNAPNLAVEITSDFVSFTPTLSFNTVMFFFPGALVDPDSYAPLCRRIAENGFQVVIVRMPWRLATFGYNKIIELNLLNDKTKKYILAGHSQGGKMAAQFVYENPSLINKLILLGTTHPRDIDISNIQIPVLKIFASKDGIANQEKVISNKSKLPSDTKYVKIDGGNHSQFGFYGYQLGDNEASITREIQQQIIFENIILFINQINKTP